MTFFVSSSRPRRREAASITTSGEGLRAPSGTCGLSVVTACLQLPSQGGPGAAPGVRRAGGGLTGGRAVRGARRGAGVGSLARLVRRGHRRLRRLARAGRRGRARRVGARHGLQRDELGGSSAAPLAGWLPLARLVALLTGGGEHEHAPVPEQQDLALPLLLPLLLARLLARLGRGALARLLTALPRQRDHLPWIGRCAGARRRRRSGVLHGPRSRPSRAGRADRRRRLERERGVTGRRRGARGRRRNRHARCEAVARGRARATRDEAQGHEGGRAQREDRPGGTTAGAGRSSFGPSAFGRTPSRRCDVVRPRRLFADACHERFRLPAAVRATAVSSTAAGVGPAARGSSRTTTERVMRALRVRVEHGEKRCGSGATALRGELATSRTCVSDCRSPCMTQEAWWG